MKLSARIVLIVCSSIIFVGNAFAADLEEIIVTATRRSVGIQDIPYNISAMTGEQLEAANVTNLADLSKAIPGIAYSDLGLRSSGINNQLILRGLNVNIQGSIGAYVPNITVAPVSTYFDNTPLFTPLKISDVERVEVLRGPQGTLYGSGSIGGTLRFIFNKPNPEKFEAKLNTGFNTVEDSDELGFNVDGVVNVPIGDTAALRISAGYEDIAGFTDGSNLAAGIPDGLNVPSSLPLADPTNVFTSPILTETREDTDSAEQYYIRASLLWEITEKLQAQLTYMRQEDDADGLSIQVNPSVAGSQERTHPHVFNSPLKRDVDLVSLELDVDLGFARLESSTSYTSNDTRNAGDLSGIVQQLDILLGGFGFGGYPTTNASLVDFFRLDTKEENIVQELRLVSQSESKFEWVAGFYYQDTDIFVHEFDTVVGFANYANTPGHPFAALLGAPPFLSWANIIAGPPGFVPQSQVDDEVWITSTRDYTIEDIALFGELTYHVTDKWQVTAGARVFWTDSRHDLFSTQPLFGAFVSQDFTDTRGLTTASVRDDVQDEIFKVNTSYDFSDDMMAYFTWAEGFRRGGANAFPTTGINTEDPSLLSFSADTVSNYEIGIKGKAFDKLTYTAAIFRVDWDHPQVAGTFLPGGFGAVFDGEEARTQGIELEGRLSVTDNLLLTAGYTYTDAEFTKDYATPLGPFDAVPDSSAADGDKLPGVPESMATWAVDYFRPINLFGLSELHIRVDGSYRSSATTAASPTAVQFVRLDGFDIWNASLGMSNDHWAISAFVKNIGDETGATAVSRDFTLARPEEAVDFISRPRTIGVMIGYTY